MIKDVRGLEKKRMEIIWLIFRFSITGCFRGIIRKTAFALR